MLSRHTWPTLKLPIPVTATELEQYWPATFFVVTEKYWSVPVQSWLVSAHNLVVLSLEYFSGPVMLIKPRTSLCQAQPWIFRV